MYASPDETLAALERVGYFTDQKTATAVYLAGRLHRPVMLEGPAGAGKTELATSFSRAYGIPLLRLQCYLHRNKMYVIGGLIVGSPNDTVESIEANLAFARQYVDWPYIQHPTPYPRTPMIDDFRRRGLIENERLEEYDGTTSVLRNEHLSADEIEYLRWKAERGMKTRHMPAAFRHDPGLLRGMSPGWLPTPTAALHFAQCWDWKTSGKLSCATKRFEGRNVITSDADIAEYSCSWLHFPLYVDGA